MKQTVLSMTFVFIFITSCDPASTKNMYDEEDDYDYETGDDTYYDGEFENSTDYNYSYSYHYEEEAELNYVPELITRPQRIVVRQGETAELPCEANVRNGSNISIYLYKLYKIQRRYIFLFLFFNI